MPYIQGHNLVSFIVVNDLKSDRGIAENDLLDEVMLCHGSEYVIALYLPSNPVRRGGAYQQREGRPTTFLITLTEIPPSV